MSSGCLLPLSSEGLLAESLHADPALPWPALPAVARIALVKPDKARGVEDIIIHAFKNRQIQEKVSEDRLIELLEQVNERTQQKAKVTFQRRRAFDDDF